LVQCAQLAAQNVIMSMRKLLPLLVLVVTGSLIGCKSNKNLNGSTYTFDFVKEDDLFNVADIAKSKDKLIFIDVYTEWCGPCKMMDKDVFTDGKLGDFFNDNFISYKVDAEKGEGPDISQLYDVMGYPTLLFLDSTGKLLVKKAGVAFQREMYELADEAIAIHSGKIEK